MISDYCPDAISLGIRNVYVKHNPNHETYRQKGDLRQKLYDILKSELDDHFDLFIVGSTQSEFSLKCSDLDLCLVFYDLNGNVDTDYLRDKNLALKKLSKIQNIVQSSDFCSKHQLISRAVVPIFRFTDKTEQITVDLNINRIVTIRNTFLLTCYRILDIRVAPLVVAVKAWARKNGINSSFHGTLSSYSLTLMVIHFLQIGCYPPVLPQLHAIFDDAFFHKKIEIRQNSAPLISMIDTLNYVKQVVYQHFRPQNHDSLAYLFFQFIRYYSNPYIFHRVISIRHSIPIFYNRLYQNWPYLMVEDPFELKNTAYSVYQQHKYCHIQMAFRATDLAIFHGVFSSNEFEYNIDDDDDDDGNGSRNSNSP